MKVVGMLLEHPFDRHGLELIIVRGRCAVRIDVCYVRGRNVGIRECESQAFGQARALGMRRGDMVGVARRRIARELAVDLGTSRQRVLLASPTTERGVATTAPRAPPQWRSPDPPVGIHNPPLW